MGESVILCIPYFLVPPHHFTLDSVGERSPASEHAKYTAAGNPGRSHKVPATPGFFNLLFSSCSTGRGRLFRFIRNHSMATATNVYLMLYPKPPLAKVLLDRPELLKEV